MRGCYVRRELLKTKHWRSLVLHDEIAHSKINNPHFSTVTYVSKSAARNMAPTFITIMLHLIMDRLRVDCQPHLNLFLPSAALWSDPCKFAPVLA